MSAEALQKQLAEEIAKFNQLQNDRQKVIQVRQQLDSQLQENTMVKEELDLMDDSVKIFKLIGPALIKQNLRESRDNVTNRMKYISAEIKRYEESIQEIEKKQDFHREAIRQIQALSQSSAARQK